MEASGSLSKILSDAGISAKVRGLHTACVGCMTLTVKRRVSAMDLHAGMFGTVAIDAEAEEVISLFLEKDTS